MTKAEAEAAKQRCEKATPGPWESSGTMSVSGDYVWCEVESVPDEMFIAETEVRHGENIPFEANANFIANSRTDLPAALDMLERVMKFVTTAHELGCFIDDDDPDTTKLWHRADALVQEWRGEAVER